MGMPLDPSRLRITTARLDAEHLNERLDGVDATPPAETSWRYRQDGPPRVFALTGIVCGFVLFVVPGLFALRSYRHWRSGVIAEPTAAWTVALATAIGIVFVSVYLVLPIVAVLLAFTLGIGFLTFLAPRR